MIRQLLLAVISTTILMISGCNNTENSHTVKPTFDENSTVIDVKKIDNQTTVIPTVEKANKSRKAVLPSEPAKGIVEMPATPSLSLGEIKLGDASSVKKDIFKPAPVSDAPQLIKKQFTIVNPNTLITITATPDDHIGFRLGLKEISDDQSNKNLIFDKRHYGRTIEPLKLVNISLPAATYEVMVRRDRFVNVNLKIDTLAAPQTVVTDTGDARNLVLIDNDILGKSNPFAYFLKPQGLSDDKVYTAILSFPDGSGSFSVLNENGQAVNSRGGKSPLTLTGLRGDKWALNVTRKVVKKQLEDTKWRLRIVESGDAFSFDESLSVETISPDKKKAQGEFRGWLDRGDLDSFIVANNQPEPYYLHYNGPIAKITNKSGSNSGSILGNKMRLGPFGVDHAIELTIQAQRESYGAYTLEHKAIDSKEVIALEPDSGGITKRYDKNDRVHGSISHSGDNDFITFDLGDTAQMWRPIVLGETISDIDLRSPYASLYRTRRDVRKNSKKRFSLPDLYMGPGPVNVVVSGQAGDYRVFMKPLGPPLQNSEREPNQSPFFRRVTFEQNYRGTLEQSDTDNYAFFLEKPARINVDLSIPAGGVYQLDHMLNGIVDQKFPQYRKPLTGSASYEMDFQPGENILSLVPRTPSPAEYGFKISFISPFDVTDGSPKNIIEEPISVKAFSLKGQRISLKSISVLPKGGPTKIWTPSAKIKLNLLTDSLEIASDVPNGVYPLWISNVDESDIVKLEIVARNDVPDQDPHEASVIPPSMRGGINVALAALGAKWMSQPGFELDEKRQLARNNSANAHNLNALNDGISALSSDSGYYHTFSNKSAAVYQPVIKLAGEKLVPIIGVVLTNRIQSLNNFDRFAVDVSTDNVTWSEVINDTLESWDQRNIFPFPDGVVDAAYVRLRPVSEGLKNQLIALSEFEVIAKPGDSGLGSVMITNTAIGAAGRFVNSKGYARDIMVGLKHIYGKPDVIETTESGYTNTGLTLSFKNQSIAEIDDVEFHFGEQISNWKGAVSPRYANLMGSTSGPNGDFTQSVEIEIPQDFGVNGIVKIALPERIRANAVRIEYKAASEPTKVLQLPEYYRLFERPESDHYTSILGLSAEYQARPYDSLAKAPTDAVIYSENTTKLSIDERLHSGAVELGVSENSWVVEPDGSNNTIVLTAKGEKGFFPNIQVTTLVGEPIDPLESIENTVTGETSWHFDLPNSGLKVIVSEPPRSTVFLMDQSPSAQTYIAQARRSVMDYADMMVNGEDKVHFAALGRDWMSKDWITDPIVLRRQLVEYPTNGNSDGESAISKAAEKLRGVSGTRSIVILTDGDVGPNQEMFNELAKSNARVFPIKLSSAKIWGNPVLATTTAVQWSEVTEGEIAYVMRAEDITDAYARVAARLLGPKSYELRAKSKTRLISPGTLSVKNEGSLFDQNKLSDNITHHILFDASGSMLKRTGNTRRIEIARKALVNFVQDSLSDNQKIGLRVFGGAPDTCETNLVVSPDAGTRDAFLSAVLAISPQNKAKTPIATAISKLKADLANTSGSARILLITDGEETCEGDAGAIIDELVTTNLADRVDIVSFALGAEVDRSDFQDWAKRGKGLYVDAQDGASLAQALKRTIQARYDVLDGDEIIISSQIGGEPVILPKGEYTVRALGKRYPAKVKSGELTKILIR